MKNSLEKLEHESDGEEAIQIYLEVKSEHSIARVNESLIRFRQQLAMKKNHQLNLEL